MRFTVKEIFGKARFIRAFSFVWLLFLIGCGSVEQRIEAANSYALKSGFSIQTIDTGIFSLYSAQRFSSQQDVLNIVIEGDGFAFVDRFHVSDDPTPLNPIGLELASKFPHSIVYLGRPCQYVTSAGCSPHFWSDQRFAPVVLSSFDKALDYLKARSSAQSVRLIGYSGGGYVAMRLAATRDDISEVVTVAGLLDPQAWNRYHDLSPLQNTPLRTAVNDTVAYKHICGGEDEVIPCALTRAFISQNPSHRMQVIHEADHGDIAEYMAWQELL